MSIEIDFKQVCYRVNQERDGEKVSKLWSAVPMGQAKVIMSVLMKRPVEKEKKSDLKAYLDDLDKNQFPIRLNVQGKLTILTCDRKFSVDGVHLSHLGADPLRQAVKAVIDEKAFVYDKDDRFSKHLTMTRLLEQLNYLCDNHSEEFPLSLQLPDPPSPCCVLDCPGYARVGCTYCHHYHYACQVVIDERSKFEKLGGPNKLFRLELCDVIQQQLLRTHDNKRNKLQPGDSKLEAPRRFKNLLDVLIFYEPLYKVYSALHDPQVGGSESLILQDQRYRATFLASTLGDCPVFRLMFGYEGFFISFLQQVRSIHGDRRLKSLKVEVVDIDRGVTSWHARMLPCDNITCSTANVYDHWANPTGCLTYDYLNFCGIGGDVGWSNILAFLQNKGLNFPLLLSFSTARKAAKKDYEASLKASSATSCWRVLKVGHFRKDFVTYCVFPRGQARHYGTIMEDVNTRFNNQSQH
jgi:hypothetical protein